MVACPNCGRQAPETQTFCGDCGARLDGQETRSGSNTCLTCLVIAVIAFVVFLMLGGSFYVNIG